MKGPRKLHFVQINFSKGGENRFVNKHSYVSVNADIIFQGLSTGFKVLSSVNEY